jgi:hypothetical protein
MGQALRRGAAGGGAGRRAARPVVAALVALLLLCAPAWLRAQPPARRTDGGRFTFVSAPADLPLARSLLSSALARDTFPGLPRPRARVTIAIAADDAQFRALVGPAAPEWGAAVAFPASQRIVLQGRRAGSSAGDPVSVLRHELAHLALHEALGDLPPRWFDEGYASYAASEWGREEALLTNVALALGGMPSLDSLEQGFYAGASRAEHSYALAYRAVAELASLDTARGLALFFDYWKGTGSFDRAVRQAYGMTQPAFERLWQSRTRRRYGALALVTNLSIVTGVFTIVLGPLYVARRRRDRARMAALRAADAAAERAERESVLAALLAGAESRPPIGGAEDEGERRDGPVA